MRFVLVSSKLPFRSFLTESIYTNRFFPCMTILPQMLWRLKLLRGVLSDPFEEIVILHGAVCDGQADMNNIFVGRVDVNAVHF